MLPSKLPARPQDGPYRKTAIIAGACGGLARNLKEVGCPCGTSGRRHPSPMGIGATRRMVVQGAVGEDLPSINETQGEE